jgi:hypothetical protein
MLLALVIYQFGKEIDYPEALVSKARTMILHVLKSNDLEQNMERRKLVREFVEEFDKYKKEDLKKYMYELGVEYAQLQDIKDRLSDSENDDRIWHEQIEILQKKILAYVHQSNGYDHFQNCLASLLSMKQEIVEQCMEKAYWNMILQDLKEKKYDLLIQNFSEIKEMILEIHNDEDTKEIMDEAFLKQLLENDIFDDKALEGQIEFIFGKLKKYGIPVYDSLIDKTKKSLIEQIREKGMTPEIIVSTFQKIMPMTKFYLDVIRIYRKKLFTK